MDWLTDNSGVIAAAALVLSIVIAIAQLIGFLLREPRVHWVLDTFTLELPEPGEVPFEELLGERRAMFTFRNAGTGTAHLFTIRTHFKDYGWLLYGYRRDMTMPPESTFEIHATGRLTVREDLKSRWSMGDGFWYETDDVIKLEWTHHPALIPLKVRRTIRLEEIQLQCVPKQRPSLPPMQF